MGAYDKNSNRSVLALKKKHEKIVAHVYSNRTVFFSVLYEFFLKEIIK